MRLIAEATEETHPFRPEELPEFDRTEEVPCQSALRQAGINEPYVAKKLKGQLEAKRRRWNPKKKTNEEFPDNDAQLDALRVVIKIFGGYPAENETSGEVIYYYRAMKPGLKDRLIKRIDPNEPVHTTRAPADSADVTAEVICASELRRVGVDEAHIAKKLKELTEAKEPRWNPKKKELELIADNHARLAATKELLKMLDSYPSDEKGPVDIIIPDWKTPKENTDADYKLVMRVPGR